MGEEFLHGILHFDTKAWRTLPMLVAKPGHLTRNYINGQRTRYVSPLALFLFMMFLMFFAVSLSRTPHNPDQAKSEAGLAAMISKYQSKMTQAVATAGVPVRTGVQPAPGKAADSIKTGIGALDKSLNIANQNPDLVLYKLKSSISKYTFLLVPLSLPFLWLMFFWRRGVTMYDHAVFVMYSLSFMALLVISFLLLKAVGLRWVALVGLALAPVHIFLQLRHAYGLSLAQSAWRAVAIHFSALVVLVLYGLAILVLTVQ
ncbi:MAG: DUF3667 domain-containing protein [Pseudomonadota bacterium]